MKDIDFDELDKAVNSLMGGVPTTSEAPRTDDGVKTLVLNPTQPMTQDEGAVPSPVAKEVSVEPTVISAQEAPKSDAPADATAPKVELAKRAAPMSSRPEQSLASRRAGRFMDVMHPSSDMTKVTAPTVSRTSGTIEPLNDVAVADAPAPTSTPSKPVQSSEPQVPESEWPDPLDMMQARQSLTTQADVTATLDDALDEVVDQPEPLSSPFLPDAKVEKRPLGSPAPELSAPSIPTPTETNNVDTVTTPAPAEMTPLPEELRGDLMAIESSQADTTGPASRPVVRPTTTAPPVAQQQASGPASIPQQYKESPSSGDQTNGAIYDTDSYHKPLQHPVKKKPGWLWILWVVILLIIGAGGGAVAYFFLLK